MLYRKKVGREMLGFLTCTIRFSRQEDKLRRTIREREVMKKLRPLITSMQQQAERALLSQRLAAELAMAEKTARTILISNCVLIVLMGIAGGALYRALHAGLEGFRGPSGIAWKGYAAAVVGTALAAFLRWALGMMVGDRFPLSSRFIRW